jgi:DMSO/TMAO reductase YedYZ molybdopterin-dependent catalytic subunit
MNGEALPAEHGFPVRMIVPGLYGYMPGTKWIADMDVTTFAAQQSYWLQRGWAQQAPIKTETRIERPQGFASMPAGKLTCAGIAWSQPTGISKVEVEVRMDGGPWQTAQLATPVSGPTWRMWRTDFTLAPGSHTGQPHRAGPRHRPRRRHPDRRSRRPDPERRLSVARHHLHRLLTQLPVPHAARRAARQESCYQLMQGSSSSPARISHSYV